LPAVNREITASSIRLVDADGTMVGIVALRDALAKAEEAGLDLVEISPTAEPPVCKIMDFGKYKYEAQKKTRDARKRQKTVELKEIKLRPTIGQNDYDVKLRSIIKFLNEGNKVKITVRFRGREITHQEVAVVLLDRLKVDVDEVAKIEYSPRMEGRQMLMILAPKAAV
jgi:translation initiation factor IF-3